MSRTDALRSDGLVEAGHDGQGVGGTPASPAANRPRRRRQLDGDGRVGWWQPRLLGAKLFAWTATPKVIHGGRHQEVDPEANLALARLSAIQRYQADLSREVSRLLRELRLLRAGQAPAEQRHEPEPAVTAGTRIEPELPVTNTPEPQEQDERGAGRPPLSRQERRRLAALERRTQRLAV